MDPSKRSVVRIRSLLSSTTHTRYYDMCALIFSPGIVGQPEKCSMPLLIYRDLASNLLWCPLSRFCVAAKQAVNIFHQSHGARRTPFRPKIPSLLLSQIRIFSIATAHLCESEFTVSVLYIQIPSKDCNQYIHTHMHRMRAAPKSLINTKV